MRTFSWSKTGMQEDPHGMWARAEAAESPAIAAADDFLTMLSEMAQSWRDEAFGGQHVSELRSNILEECADELTLAVDARCAAARGTEDT